MIQKHGRAVAGALVLGVVVAMALEVGWPGAWRLGSTPRFVVTAALAVAAAVVLAMRRRS
jgi:hypothetical protein